MKYCNLLFLKEFFVEYLAQEIYRSSGKKNELTYSGLAEIVQTSDAMEFLKGLMSYVFFVVFFKIKYQFCIPIEMVPRKITFKDYQELMKKDKETAEYWFK